MVSFGTVFIIIAVLLIGMLIIYMTYNLLKTVGVLPTYIVSFVIFLIVTIIMNKTCNIRMLGISAILSLVSVVIQNWIYQKSDTFEEFIKKIIILGICMALVVFLFTFLFTITINSMQF